MLGKRELVLKLFRSIWETIKRGDVFEPLFCTGKSKWKCGGAPFCQQKGERSWLRPGLGPFATDGCCKAECKASPVPIRGLSQTSARNECCTSECLTWAVLALSHPLPPPYLLKRCQCVSKKLRWWWTNCCLFFSPNPCWQTKPSTYTNCFAQASVTNIITHKRRTRDAIASAGTTGLCVDLGKHAERASLAVHPSVWSWRQTARCFLNHSGFYVTSRHENRGL